MLSTNLPDITRSETFQIQRATLDRQLDLARNELVSGRSAEPARLSPSAAAELERITAAGFRAHSERIELGIAAARLATQQDSLQQLKQIVDQVMSAAWTNESNDIAPKISERDALTLVSDLATALAATDGERRQFSGSSQLSTPLTSDNLLATARSEIAASGSITAGLEAMFSDGGAFETVYAPLAPAIPEGTYVAAAALTSKGIESALKGALALAIGADETLTLYERSQANQVATNEAELGQVSLLTRQAELGLLEQKIEQRLVAVQSEATALTLREDALIGVDPADAATRVQAVVGQLETLYTLIRRSSDLSLARML